MVSVPPTPPMSATVHPSPSPPASGIRGTTIPRTTASQSLPTSAAVTSTVTNISPMQTLITLSNRLKPPARTSARPTRLADIPKTTFPVAASGNTGTMACTVTPQALISADPTKKLHSRK
jgi:hypothetical protein